jgi:hypothetical protein
MRIYNFEKFRGGNTYPDPLKRRKNREERGIGQGNGRERKIEGLGRKEITGREGIDGRSPFTNPRYATIRPKNTCGSRYMFLKK